MRVFIVEFDGEGGMLHFAQLLAEGLTAAGAEVTLVTDRRYELGELPRSFAVRPVLNLWDRVTPEDGAPGRTRRMLRRAGRGVLLMRAWLRVRRLLRRERPDLVLFGIIRFPVEGLVLRSLAADGLRLMQICHEFEAREAAGGWWRRGMVAMNRSAFRSFRAIVFLSGTTRSAFLEHFGELAGRTHVMPHGPSLLFGAEEGMRRRIAYRYGLAAGERVVLMFGGLRPSKGVPDLVKAFARLRGRTARLVIAGYPSKEFDVDELRREIRALGIEGRVIVDPRYLAVEEVGSLVSLADVVVFPYRSATASGALSLAQVLARPVVASAIGGLAEEVEDGVTGLLVPPGDVDALAEAIGRLLDAPEAAQAMGEAGREAVMRSRSWEGIGARILAVAGPGGIVDGGAVGGAGVDSGAIEVGAAKAGR